MKKKDLSVKDYYDKNTKRFLDLGQGGKQLAIHRAVWGPNIRTRPEAMHFVHDQILKYLSPTSKLDSRFLDLGCGVGGSLHYLHSKQVLRYQGMSISLVQVDLANSIIQEAQIDNISIKQGDYLQDQYYQEGTPFDFVLNYESFLHASAPEKLIKLVSKHTHSNSFWFVCDDFLSSKALNSFDEKETNNKSLKKNRIERYIAEFKAGWHAPGLLRTDDFETYVSKAGFKIEEVMILNEYLELLRPRDRFISFFVALSRWIKSKAAWYENLLGGNALQKLLLENVLEYRFYVLKKQ